MKMNNKSESWWINNEVPKDSIIVEDLKRMHEQHKIISDYFRRNDELTDGELTRMSNESMDAYRKRCEAARRAHKEVFEEAPDELV